MHGMLVFVIDDVFPLWLHCANTAEQVNVLLGVKTLEDPRYIVLDGSSDFLHGFDAAFTKLLWPLV